MQSIHKSIRVIIVFVCIIATGSLQAQELSKTISKKITLQYISSTDLIDADIAKADTILYCEWRCYHKGKFFYE